MTARKLAFASDFDGTLCESDWNLGIERFDPRNLEAVRRFRETGGLFGICTGRSLGGTLQSTQDIVDFDFYIVLSGAQILDRDLRVIQEKALSRELVCELYERYARGDATFIAPQGDTYVAVGATHMPAFEVVSSIDELPGPFFGVSLEYVGDEEAARADCADLNARYGDQLAAFQNLASVDIVPVGCSKGSGVRAVKEALGASLVAGMGDSYNDLPMLEAADVAYTFNKSPEEVQRAADAVFDTLAEALEDFSLRRQLLL